MSEYVLCRQVPAGREAAAAEALARGAEAGAPLECFTAPGFAVVVIDAPTPPVDGSDVMTEVIRREAGAGGELHALRYPVRPGMADIAERVFRGSGDPPLVAGSTRLLRTSVHRRGDVLVRLFAIDGDVDELVEGLARAVEVHQVGERMAALFVGSYDFTSGAGLRAFFADHLMEVRQDRPAPRQQVRA